MGGGCETRDAGFGTQEELNRRIYTYEQQSKEKGKEHYGTIRWMRMNGHGKARNWQLK